MSDVAKRVIGYVIAGAIAAFLVSWTFGRIEGLLGINDTRITAASDSALARHPWRDRFRDSLAAVQASFHDSADRLASTALTLSSNLDQTQRRLDSLERAGHPASAADWRLLAAGYRLADSGHAAAYQACRWEVTECARRAQDAEQEADSLARQLHAQTGIRPRRCAIDAGVSVLVGKVWPFRGPPDLGTAAGASLGLSCQVFRLPF